MQNDELLWKSQIILWFDLADLFVSFICPTILPRPVYLCVFNWASGSIEYGLWQHSRQKLFSLHTIKFHCPFSHQGIVVEIALKWTISLVCAPYPPGQAENISLWGKGNWGGGGGLGLSFSVFTHILYYLVGLNHIADYNSSHFCARLSLFSSVPPFLLSYLCFCPWPIPEGDTRCHPSHLWGLCSLTTQQPVVPRGPRVLQQGARAEIHIGLRSEMGDGKRSGYGGGQNRVQDVWWWCVCTHASAREEHAHKQKCCLRVGIAVRSCCVWALSGSRYFRRMADYS